MNYKNIIAEQEDGVLTIKLNRPKVLNALTGEMKLELIHAFQNVEDNPEVRVIVLAGEGRSFSAGGDINRMDNVNPIETFDYLGVSKKLILLMSRLTKPIIAAVHGHAAGGGASLALACDIILTSETSKFSFSFSRIGLIPDNGGVFYLVHTLGVYRTKEILLKGESISAERAFELGLVNHIYKEDEFKAKTMEFANRLAQGSVIATEQIKSITNNALVESLESILEREQAIQPIVQTSAEHKEGVQAFKEKRKPNFNS